MTSREPLEGQIGFSWFNNPESTIGRMIASAYLG